MESDSNQMIVAYDARPLQPQTRHWGVGVLVDNLLSRLSQRFQFSGIAHRFVGAEREGIRTWPKIPYTNSIAFEASLLLLKEYDIYWGTNHFLPALTRRPSVVTVHDLLLLKYRSDQPYTRYLAWRFISSVKRAHRVIANSRTTADELLAAFPDVGKKLEVGLLGFDAPADVGGDDSCPGQLGAESPYVVMLGAHRPRKNLALAVAAVSQVRKGGSRVKLLVTGDLHPSFEGLVSGATEFVSCLGVLPRPSLFVLLKGAVGLMFPSFYEGFGFPMLEAMAAGCPVLALDTPIGRETGGEAAWYLPPGPRSWSEALGQLLSRPSLRLEMQEKGFINLRRFSWEKTATVYADVFAELGARAGS
jgi:glycosyltransferase involved in cell wall biosynthesis